MNRDDILQFEQSTGPARRAVLGEGFEFRRTEDGKLAYRGYASTTEQAYPVYGGTFPGWTETIAQGAFKRTLNNNASVQFLINHAGMELASTRAGTLKLTEDATGLLSEAKLNPKVSAVSDLYELSRDGHMREMSFGFQVVADEWLTDDGEPATDQTGSQRRITEVNMNKGDVSAVNYGANDHTTGGFRALAELRDGRLPSDPAARALFGEQRAMVTGAEMQLQRIEQAVAEIRAMFVVETATTTDGIPMSWHIADAPDETRAELARAVFDNLKDFAAAHPPMQQRDPDPDPLLAAYVSLWDQLRDTATPELRPGP